MRHDAAKRADAGLKHGLPTRAENGVDAEERRPDATWEFNDNDIDEFIDYDASAIDRERGEERWHHEKVSFVGRRVEEFSTRAGCEKLREWRGELTKISPQPPCNKWCRCEDSERS